MICVPFPLMPPMFKKTRSDIQNYLDTVKICSPKELDEFLHKTKVERNHKIELCPSTELEIYPDGSCNITMENESEYLNVYIDEITGIMVVHENCVIIKDIWEKYLVAFLDKEKGYISTYKLYDPEFHFLNKKLLVVKDQTMKLLKIDIKNGIVKSFEKIYEHPLWISGDYGLEIINEDRNHKTIYKFNKNIDEYYYKFLQGNVIRVRTDKVTVFIRKTPKGRYKVLEVLGKCHDLEYETLFYNKDNGVVFEVSKTLKVDVLKTLRSKKRTRKFKVKISDGRVLELKYNKKTDTVDFEREVE